MPSVTFEIPAVLRRYSGGRADVAVEAATAAAALDAMLAAFPDLRPRVLDAVGRVFPYLLLFRNGVALDRDALAGVALRAGDVIAMVGAAEGGSGAGVPDDHGGDHDHGGDDVRMRGFRVRVSVAEALAVALDGLVRGAVSGALSGTLSGAVEHVHVTAAAGRVLAEDVTSDVNVPEFRRAAMDGYAVRGADTFGATLHSPIRLQVIGESMPGARALPTVGVGDACRIMTGAPVPDGADAVLRAEDTHPVEVPAGGAWIEVTADVAPGRNAARVGEDVKRGDLLLRAGRRLRPQDVGLLASVGGSPVAVVARPRVRLLVTGNELLPPGERPDGHRIVDSNSPMLAALVARDGCGAVLEIVRLPDDRDAIRAALARTGADVILTSGGTSVGREDYLPVLVRELGDLTVHGIAMRPAAPTGIGRVGAARVFLLPGNPVACLSAYDFFAGAAIRTLAGLPASWPYGAAELPVAGRIASQIGRTDYVRVSIGAGGARPIATSGASILSSTTRADGFVVVPAGSEGLPEGATATVHLYDAWTL